MSTTLRVHLKLRNYI